jgi:ABC-type glycerol-3-phosphate transport system substrate-binding protein
MMMPKRSILMGLVMVLALAACGERGTTEPENEFPRMRGSQVVFHFAPRANHTITSIVVAGSFGAEGTPQFWNAENQQFAMTQQANGN